MVHCETVRLSRGAGVTAGVGGNAGAARVDAVAVVFVGVVVVAAAGINVVAVDGDVTVIVVGVAVVVVVAGVKVVAVDGDVSVIVVDFAVVVVGAGIGAANSNKLSIVSYQRKTYLCMCVCHITNLDLPISNIFLKS